MPTHHEDDRFWRDYDRLTDAEIAEFAEAVADFVIDLGRGSFRNSLHVHMLQGFPGVFSMAWGAGKRATFRYGEQVQLGEPHIIWQRIGGHEIYREP